MILSIPDPTQAPLCNSWTIAFPEKSVHRIKSLVLRGVSRYYCHARSTFIISVTKYRTQYFDEPLCTWKVWMLIPFFHNNILAL